MATTNVHFYEKVKDLQEIQHSSEQKRMELEQELNSYVKSDQRLAKLRAVRLQNYWKKICEDEKRSQWRNEQLLRDVERVENHMASLSEKTEKLKTMKRQYEEYIERMYPQWKEKVMVYQQQRKEAEHLALEREKLALQQSFASTIPQQYQAHAAGLVASTPVSHYSVPPAHPTFTPQNQSVAQTPIVGLGGTQQRLQLARDILSPMARSVDQGTAQSIPQYQSPPVVHEHARSPSPPRGSLREDPRYQHLHTVPQQNLSPGETVLPQPAAGGLQQAPGSGLMVASSGASTMNAIPSLPIGATPNSTLGDLQGNLPKESIMPQTQPQHAHSSFVPHSTQDVDPTPREVQSAAHQKVSGRRQSAETISQQYPDLQPRTPRGSQDSPQHSARSRQRSVSAESDGFGSDTSLPLSPREESRVLEVSTGLPSARSGDVEAENDIPYERVQSPIPRPQSTDPISEKDIYPEPDVTLDGLYNLLYTVQSSFQYSATPNDFYREDVPPVSVKKDIIDHANRGATLSHLDTRSVSMVVLEQLPLVVVNCEDNCLLPDKLLYSPAADVNQHTIRSFVHPTCKAFWEKLYDHFVKITKYHVMEPEETGRMFAPLVIRTDSPYEERAVRLITDLLENLPPEETVPSPGSTATLSSLPMSPRTKPPPRPDADPRVKLPGMDTDISEEEGDHFAQPLPKEEATGALTQSAAYRALLGETMSTQRSAQFEYEDSDESDDVERQLTCSITSPRVKLTKKPTHSKSEDVLVSSSLKEEDKSENSVSLHSGGLSSAQDPQIAAYVPTAMDNTGKSTMSLSSKSARKPGFRFGDSDTDEDVDVLGTGQGSKQDAEKDDFFDFYD